jgi:hypothetical protein
MHMALAGFQSLLESSHVVWHLIACLPHRQRHEDLADAVPGEVDADGQARPAKDLAACVGFCDFTR